MNVQAYTKYSFVFFLDICKSIIMADKAEIPIDCSIEVACQEIRWSSRHKKMHHLPEAVFT